MSADEHLSPHQFPEYMARMKELAISKRHAIYPEKPDRLFHGTHAALPEGANLTIGRPSNYPGRTMDVNAHHVYATGDASEAYYHGHNALERADPNGGSGYYGAIATPHVYEVHPTGRLTRDPEIDRADWEGGDASYRSRQPMRVGREVSRGARNDYIENYGHDYGAPDG